MREQRVNCSFINVEGKIYAIKNGECVGEGNFGKVKIIQARNRNNFAVKIEGRQKRGETDPELAIMKTLNHFHGEAERLYGKIFKGQYSHKKLYTVMDFHEGNELLRELYVGKTDETPHKNLTEEQKLLLAIRAAQAIQYLHAHKVIHADIKPANLMTRVDGDVIVMAAIDFGFSMVLNEGQKVLQDTCKGSPLYCAPEILELNYDNKGNPVSVKRAKDPASYSFASDIFALGVMFKYDFQLKMEDAFYKKIMNTDPSQRPSMDELIEALYSELEKQPNLSSVAQKMLQERQQPEEQNNQTQIDAKTIQINRSFTPLKEDAEIFKSSTKKEQALNESDNKYQHLVEVLETCKNNLDVEYKNKRHHSGWGRWFKHISSGRDARKDQMSNLTIALNTFIENPTDINMNVLKETLTNIKNDIDKEFHFLGSSGLKVMITDIEKKIETTNEQLLESSKRGPSHS
ncbi:protein kinase [Candidatus Berkiella cookevillensis]|uniref:Protein kinase n=1 Tax=Candidatus Berkiella cookevillensis TaxID=437022 RepID=A0A0Q9YRV6_9GAMM|nr:protein kinase [Candidatus Berkiella cookevillensis]MCS5707665.1 protein kinase [Candidatus Berkiella cookevillensis]